jgi:hypothetical protein
MAWETVIADPADFPSDEEMDKDEEEYEALFQLFFEQNDPEAAADLKLPDGSMAKHKVAPAVVTNGSRATDEEKDALLRVLRKHKDAIKTEVVARQAGQRDLRRVKRILRALDKDGKVYSMQPTRTGPIYWRVRS